MVGIMGRLMFVSPLMFGAKTNRCTSFLLYVVAFTCNYPRMMHVASVITDFYGTGSQLVDVIS